MNDHKIRKPREVDWNNPHAYFMTRRDGTIVDGLSQYDSFMENIGYDGKPNNLLDFLDSCCDDRESFKVFKDKFYEVSSGNKIEYELDYWIGGFHYHMTLSKLKGGVGIHFGDQTKATSERDTARRERGIAEKRFRDSLEVIHDIRSLGSGFTLVDAIEKHYKRGNPDRAERLMESLKHIAGTAEALINTYMDIGTAEAGAPFKWEHVMFSRDIVEPVISSVQHKISNRGATIERRYITSSGDTELYCDKRRMRSVFFQLVNNALDYGEDGMIISWGQKALSEHGENAIGKRVNLWNSKSHIPTEHQEIVFKDFFTTGGAEGKERTGLGLNLVKRTIVDEHHGDISIDSGYDNNVNDVYTNIIIDLYSEDYLREKGLILDE